MIIKNKDEIISNLEIVLDKICNKKELSEDAIEFNPIVLSKEKRHLAFENAKYMCEECGSIANIDVYNINSSGSDENLKVLCKKCSEEYCAKMNLHYD